MDSLSFSAIVILLALSLLFGSFLGVVVDRLPRRVSLISPRSYCGDCGETLRARDLLPLVSFVLLRGRCRYCDAAIPPALPWIEVASAGVMLWALAVVPLTVLMPTVALGWSLLVLATIDARHFLLLDRMTLPLMCAGCAVSVWLPELDWPMHVAGALVGLSAFAAVRVAFFALRGIEGLGWGDVKLFGAAGAWLGVEGLPNTLLIGATTGLLFVVFRYRKLELTRAIPFGFFLCLGIWLTWLYGPIALVG